MSLHWYWPDVFTSSILQWGLSLISWVFARARLFLRRRSVIAGRAAFQNSRRQASAVSMSPRHFSQGFMCRQLWYRAASSFRRRSSVFAASSFADFLHAAASLQPFWLAAFSPTDASRCHRQHISRQASSPPRSSVLSLVLYAACNAKIAAIVSLFTSWDM